MRRWVGYLYYLESSSLVPAIKQQAVKYSNLRLKCVIQQPAIIYNNNNRNNVNVQKSIVLKLAERLFCFFSCIRNWGVIECFIVAGWIVGGQWQIVDTVRWRWCWWSGRVDRQLQLRVRWTIVNDKHLRSSSLVIITDGGCGCHQCTTHRSSSTMPPHSAIHSCRFRFLPFATAAPDDRNKQTDGQHNVPHGTDVLHFFLIPSIRQDTNKYTLSVLL